MAELRRLDKRDYCDCRWCPECGWSGPCCGECDTVVGLDGEIRYQCPAPVFLREPLDEITHRLD